MLDIGEYKGIYAITEEGKVWSYPRFKKGHGCLQKIGGYFKKQSLTNKGYWQVDLWKNNKGKKHLIHRLLAKAFIPNPLNLLEVNHKNAIKTDNRLANLEWCSHLQNVRHGFALGLRNTAVGERASKSKLKEYQVIDIRKRYKFGFGASLAREYGVDDSVVSEIISRKIWKHI